MRFLLITLIFLTGTQAHALDQSVIDASGLPLPRFVSLRSNEVNMRVGPGTHYPIQWTYQQKHLPVEVFEEFGHWRHVRDQEGTTGWMHRNLLSSRRSGVLLDEPTILYIAPREDSAITIQAGKGTIGLLQSCQEIWCSLKIADRIGWTKKKAIWGVYETDEFSGS